MQLKIEKTQIEDVLIVIPEVFEDERGFFMEIYRADQFKELGLPYEFVQDNHSRSAKGVLRGLHFQWEPPMGKLMRVTFGSAYLVAVDIRKGSPTLGKWVGMEISAKNKKQILEQKLIDSKYINEYLDNNLYISYLDTLNNHLKFGIIYGYHYLDTMLS